ncbi:hypothetical protein [Nucisporomicrobium flavum]|uniref:hypothetical protein n=1 Tax=Nucisporomicrobium flavum TaxID=2785915 RepID=UPI001F19F858|nr:hypothetical protein [Nucisporomicrobium flavum]
MAILSALARSVLRGVLPYPDLPRRIRVRRTARTLATSSLLPRDEEQVTGEHFARLALLRLLFLQRETRRAVRMRQREAAALLARTGIETCILGLWCLLIPGAAAKLRASEFKTGAAMLTFLSGTGLISQQLIRQAVGALGEPQSLPGVRTMTEQIDKKTSATLAIHLYDVAYRPASQYFTHATNSALRRHVTTDYGYKSRPANSWVRRAPVRLVDACVGVLAGAIANDLEVPGELFVQYGEDHAKRVLPPLLATIGKGMGRQLRWSGIVAMLNEARATRAYLAGVGAADTPEEREARLRSMYDSLLIRLEISDVPPDAFRPVVDHFIAVALVEWNDEQPHQLTQPLPGSGEQPTP